MRNILYIIIIIPLILFETVDNDEFGLLFYLIEQKQKKSIYTMRMKLNKKFNITDY